MGGGGGQLKATHAPWSRVLALNVRYYVISLEVTRGEIISARKSSFEILNYSWSFFANYLELCIYVVLLHFF